MQPAVQPRSNIAQQTAAATAAGAFAAGAFAFAAAHRSCLNISQRCALILRRIHMPASPREIVANRKPLRLVVADRLMQPAVQPRADIAKHATPTVPATAFAAAHRPQRGTRRRRWPLILTVRPLAVLGPPPP